MGKKIKVYEEAITIEGDLKDGKVKSTGNSGHIVVSKEHVGERVSVIYPTEKNYFWCLGNPKLSKFMAMCEIEIDRRKGKLEKHRRDCLNRVFGNDFTIRDMDILLSMFPKSRNLIIAKVKEIYLKS